MESEKCKVQKFMLIDFAKLDEVYKKINSRVNEIWLEKVKDAPVEDEKVDSIKTYDPNTTADEKPIDAKKIGRCDIEMVDLIAEAVTGEDLITIVRCGTTGCDINKLTCDEGLDLFKKIILSEENKDFFLKSYEAKILAINPHSASLSGSGTSSSSSSEKE